MNNRFTCLLYHGLADEPPSKDYLDWGAFRQQLFWLKTKGYTVESFLGLDKRTENDQWPVSYLIVSFDDGHISNLRAADMLSEIGATATFFFVKRAAEELNNNYLRPSQIRSLARQHDIGSHSVSHSKMSQLTRPRIFRELADSKAWLEDLCGRPITSFSAPCGDYDKRVVRMAIDLGYSWFATSTPIRNHALEVRRHRTVGRISIERHTELDRFRKIVECRPGPFLLRRGRALLASPLKAILPPRTIGRLRRAIWK